MPTLRPEKEGPAIGDRCTDIDLREPELRALLGHNEIAGKDQLAPCSDGIALDW